MHPTERLGQRVREARGERHARRAREPCRGGPANRKRHHDRDRRHDPPDARQARSVRAACMMPWIGPSSRTGTSACTGRPEPGDTVRSRWLPRNSQWRAAGRACGLRILVAHRRSQLGADESEAHHAESRSPSPSRCRPPAEDVPAGGHHRARRHNDEQDRQSGPDAADVLDPLADGEAADVGHCHSRSASRTPRTLRTTVDP